MMDFSLHVYQKLLNVFIDKAYTFQTFEEFIENPVHKAIVLRHDVDKLPANSLFVAKIEHELGIKGTYYFWIVPESYDERIIKQIADMGHEIGYHYEDVSLVTQRQRDGETKRLIKVMTERLREGVTKRLRDLEKKKDALIDLAFESFCRNLEKFRKLYPVKTICMHGSPLSKFDNRLLWEKYDYRELGIIGEPCEIKHL